MLNLYPALLSDSLEEIQAQLDLVNHHPQIKAVQIDIIDGYFADNLTITPMDTVELDFGHLLVDFHLMTEEPLAMAEEIIDHCGGLNLRSVIAQVEKMTSQADYLALLGKYNLQKGLSLDLYTPVESLEKNLRAELDVVQLMTVEAGAQGQVFNEKALAKIAQLRDPDSGFKPNLEIIIDGGVNAQTLAKCKLAGATSVGVGSALWQSADIKQTLESLFAQC